MGVPRIEETSDRNVLGWIETLSRDAGFTFDSCLDVGCGLNPLVDWFRKAGVASPGAAYYATDAHDEVKAKLAERGVSALKPEELPSGFQADLVIAAEVLEHVTPTEVTHFLEDLRARTRKMLAITCPNFEYFNVERRMANDPELRFVPDHLKDFASRSADPYMHKFATTPAIVGSALSKVFVAPDWRLRVFRAWPWVLTDIPAKRTFLLHFKVFALALRTDC